MGEKGCQTENMISGGFVQLKNEQFFLGLRTVFPRSIYFDAAYLKAIVEKKTARNASITIECAPAYLDSLVCTSSTQTDELVSLVSQKCLDFELGD